MVSRDEYKAGFPWEPGGLSLSEKCTCLEKWNGIYGDVKQILVRREWRAFVRTMYKRKDRKVLPVNIPLKGGLPPGGGINGATEVEADDNHFKPIIVP